MSLTLSVRAANALTRLCTCAGSSEPSLLKHVIRVQKSHELKEVSFEKEPFQYIIWAQPVHPHSKPQVLST